MWWCGAVYVWARKKEKDLLCEYKSKLLINSIELKTLWNSQTAIVRVGEKYIFNLYIVQAWNAIINLIKINLSFMQSTNLVRYPKY